MKLADNPEPTTTVYARQQVLVPRCPVQTASGAQCAKPALNTFNELLLDGKMVRVCSVHWRAR